MYRMILPIGLILMIGFYVIIGIKIMKQDYLDDKEFDKNYSTKNNCVVQGLDLSSKLYICENELNYKISKSLENKVSKDNVSTIKIKPYNYVSSNLIGTKTSISSNSVFVYDKNGDEIFRILGIDNGIILDNIKEDFSKYNYSFIIENKKD